MATQKSTSVVQSTVAKKAIRRVKVTKTIQRTLPDGKVVTETTTEYKEATDDNTDFSDFGANNEGFSNLLSGFNTAPFQISSELQGPTFSKKADSSSSSDEDEEEGEEKFQKEALEAHNQYRTKHRVAPLKLDKKLCSYAKEWADKLIKDDSFEHRTDQELGENLYCCWSSKPMAKCPGAKPVDSWYSESKKYTFGSEPTSLGTGHFTQLVWKNTKKLGIARARNSAGKVVVVANYEPAGNWIGQYSENVLPPVDD